MSLPDLLPQAEACGAVTLARLLGEALTVILLLVVKRVLFALIAVAFVLVLFTTMQFNLRGAELMAGLGVAFYAAARAVGWRLRRPL